MAVFEIAYKITKSNEGGYTNKPTSKDRGGETYKGIARVFHPTWIGWKIVDAYKKKMGGKIPENHVIPDPALDKLVVEFYRKNFWDVIQGDKIAHQQIANLIFDFGVNGNHTTVISFVEHIINGLGFKVLVDGKIDPEVLKYLNGLNKTEIYQRLKTRIKAYYEKLAKDNPKQYAWALSGWLNRLKKFPDTILDDIKKKD